METVKSLIFLKVLNSNEGSSSLPQNANVSAARPLGFVAQKAKIGIFTANET
jgi:hypothetical protein